MELLAFTEAVYGAKIRLTATKTTSIIFIGILLSLNYSQSIFKWKYKHSEHQRNFGDGAPSLPVFSIVQTPVGIMALGRAPCSDL